MTDASAFSQLADALASDWKMKARPEQLPPTGNWQIWAILAGRGWGKTRTGSEWVLSQVRAGRKHIALLAATAADARDVMIEGPSGILSCAPLHDRPLYEPSKRRLTWKNGAVATAFSADEPDRLRGPQFSVAWADELAAHAYPEAFEQLMFGLRLGKDPQCIVTTTPRPTKIIRDLVDRAKNGKGVVITKGKTVDNEANLAASFITAITEKHAGTRLGRQELDAELLFDTPGALWQRDWLDRDRVNTNKEKLPELRRIIVAVDPAVSTGEDSDETGIVVAGVDSKGHGYILDDLSGKYQPHEWAAKAVKAYRDWGADRIIAEKNNGGDLVGHTIRMVDARVPYRAVHASRGKVTRAEPVSALFEQGKVHMVDTHPELEDQLCEFTVDYSKAKLGYSPDRVDALVWAISELCVDKQFLPTRRINLSIMQR